MAANIEITIPGLDRFTKAYQRKMYSSKHQQSFLEDIYTLIDDGVPANKAVEAVGEISTGANQMVAEDIMAQIGQGKPIAEGLKGWYPPYIVELIRSGEEGGSLGDTMRSACEALGKKNAALGSLITALTYPLVVMAMGVGVLMYLNGSVFGQFQEIKPISQWPGIGQNVVALAEFIKSSWWQMAIGIVATMVGIRYMLANYVGMYRPIIDKLPLFSLYKILSASRFMETLGLLIENGVVFKKGLDLMTLQASPYMRHHLDEMHRKLGMGQANIAQVLDTGMIAAEDIVRLRVTAASKGFEHALVRLGAQASLNAMKTVDTAANVFGGILLLLAAMLAIFMVLAIYSVGFSLAG